MIAGERSDPLVERNLRIALSEDGIRATPFGLGEHVLFIEEFAERRVDRTNGFRRKWISVHRRRTQMHDDRPVSSAVSIVDELGQRMIVIGGLRGDHNTE